MAVPWGAREGAAPGAAAVGVDMDHGGEGAAGGKDVIDPPRATEIYFEMDI